MGRGLVLGPRMTPAFRMFPHGTRGIQLYSCKIIYLCNQSLVQLFFVCA